MSSEVPLGSHPPQHDRAFDSLRLGRSSQTIHARLLRFWDTPNMINSNEIRGITMVLLDEKDSSINAFIPAEWAKLYRQCLQEGQIYEVAHFEVDSCPYMYKTTEHTFVIRFIAQTSLHKVINNGPVINLHKFMIRNSDHLHILANTNLELPDVVGVIKSVKGFGLLSTDIISPILIRFLISPNVEVYLSLLDEAAARFKGLLNSGESTKSVMVVTSLNPQKKGDHLYLNSTAATKFYFGNNLAAITEFTMRYNDAIGDDLPSLNAETVITTKELSPPGDLSKFLSNSSTQVSSYSQSLMTQEAYFTCIARIVEVVAQKGWYYVSCTHCGKEVGNSATSHPCNQCHDTTATTVVRYKVELLVDDGENYATFLVLDNEMMKLTKQGAATLLDDEVNRRLRNRLPKCIAELQGQKFIYHVNVTTDNLTDNRPTFTVSGMSAILNKEILTINGKQKKGKMEYGESSTSAAATYTSANEADKDGPTYSTE
ncbi:unnamed protein product [Brassica rapa subsp. trilocularis]